LLEETHNAFYCKIIENMMPSYFLPIWIVDGSKNV